MLYCDSENKQQACTEASKKWTTVANQGSTKKKNRSRREGAVEGGMRKDKTNVDAESHYNAVRIVHLHCTHTCVCVTLAYLPT
mmetsp:Transcript_20623/g.53026  ORF Transcript_20623/g.53026 Transcript_20623/m.53026 type:complete len:83 (+) Transcript_20623:17-265(+)